MNAAACDAARAWLERLPVAERAAAHARTDLRLAIWVGAGGLLVAACLAVARADLAGRLRRAIESRRLPTWLANGLSAGAVATMLAATKGLYDVLIAWPADGGASLGGRATAAAAGVWSVTILALLLAPPLQWLFRALPRMGAVVAGLVAIAASLAIGWGPYAFGDGPRLTPAPAGPVRDGLVRLAAEAGIPAHEIWLDRDPSFDADVTGGFGRARVVIGERVLAWPAPEARAYVGHLMGHYAHGDVFIVFLIYGMVAFLALVAVQRRAAPLARRLGARGATSPADGDAAPAAALILMIAAAVAVLTTSGYLRWANVRADAYSLDQAREPLGLAAALERTWDHGSVDPNPIETAIFYSHPPLEERLIHAMCSKTTRPN